MESDTVITEAPSIKPGLQTTEFYTPGIIALVGFVLQYVNKRYSLDLQATDVVNAIIGIGSLVGVVASYVVYVYGRIRLKVAQQATHQFIAKAQASVAVGRPKSQLG